MFRGDKMNRVVITGMGTVNPIGLDVEETWTSIRKGQHGISLASRIDPKHYKTKLAGEVKNFDPSSFIDRKEIRRMDLFSQYALAASHQALIDSHLEITKDNQYDIGVIVGSGSGGYVSMEENVLKLASKGPNKVEPFFHIKTPGNMAAANIALNYHIKGPSMSIATACASGTNAIGEAFLKIKTGQLSACLAGGAEGTLSDSTYSGFSVLRAMSTNDDPDTAMRPFDKERDGFIPAEGAGILMLESLASAEKRQAPIYAEIVGYGATTDAYHATAPDPSAESAARAMSQALDMAKVSPTEVSYINAHGTSTPLNDESETRAIKIAFGKESKKTAISSTKSYTGHMFGASGALEALVSIKAINESFIPPTLGLYQPEFDLDFVPLNGRSQTINYALSNSFGFGGHNASLLFKKY